MFALNDDFALRDQGASNALGLELLPRHRWYFVKEGFSPKIVEEAIVQDDVKKGEVMLDPFSGSGTSPLTSALNGLSPRAFELNPFLRFLSATKLLQADANGLLAESRILSKCTENPVPSPLEGYSTFTEGNRWGRWLFPTAVLRAFEAGRRASEKSNRKYRDLLRLALLGAAMDSCNAMRDGKCLRYGVDWERQQATALDFRNRFESRVNVIAEDLVAAPLTASASVVQGDARRLVASPSSEKFRICVTSPPYLNSFDYSDVYRPELFLGKFVDTNKTLMKVRLKTVRSHLQANWESPKCDDFGVLYRNCISILRSRMDDLWNPRIPEMVQAYFEDMRVILRGLRNRAKANASVWLVVSTSAYAGVEVPVDLILAEIGQSVGWFLREVGVLRYLRSASQHVKHVKDKDRKSVPLRESVVIFDALARRSKRKTVKKN